MIKIILDTNVMISNLITNSKFLKQIVELQTLKKVEIYSSLEIQTELQNTIKKPKIKDLIKVNSKKVASFLAWYKYQIRFVSPTQTITICRDLKDNMFLELAEEINADYIITGDNDLLALKNYKTTRILKPSEFMVELQLSI